MEDSVLNHYKGFTTFRDFGQGSFLQFLSRHKELETLISISPAHAVESGLGVRTSDVIDLLQQCGVDSAKVMFKLNVVDLSYLILSSLFPHSFPLYFSISLLSFNVFLYFVYSFVSLAVMVPDHAKFIVIAI